MTDAELQILANGIRASTDPVVVQARTIRDDTTLSAWCNTVAAPNVLAWSESTDPNDIDDAPDYTTFDSIAAGKRDSWGFFLRTPRDFTRNKTRKWVTDVWGNATANSNAEAILQAGTVRMTNGQVIFGGSDATTGTVTAKKRNFSGDISVSDVSSALNRF